MKVIHNHFIPFGSFTAINLFGVLFVRYGRFMPVHAFNHEEIHTVQMRELWYVGFYLIYIAEWLYKLVKYKDAMKAYYNVSFEREAYTQQYNYNYLTMRKRFAMWE